MDHETIDRKDRNFDVHPSEVECLWQKPVKNEPIEKKKIPLAKFHISRFGVSQKQTHTHGRSRHSVLQLPCIDK